MTGDYITLGEAAKKFGVRVSRLQKAANTPRLKAEREGRTWLTKPEWVSAYLQNSTERGVPGKRVTSQPVDYAQNIGTVQPEFKCAHKGKNWRVVGLIYCHTCARFRRAS